MKTLIHTNVIAINDKKLEFRIVYQNPKIKELLPFTASDGTLISSTTNGTPCICDAGGKTRVYLRNENTPDKLRNEPIVSHVHDARSAARNTRNAIADLRRAAVAYVS